MIILNEANRIKQHIADKLGIELPKGGLINPNNTELDDREKFRKARKDEDRVNTGVRRLTEPYNPKKNYAWHLGKEYADKHNLPISLAPDKEDLHRRINDRIKGALHLDKEAMMDEYKDKLTHKYGKSPSQPTPEVEAPKTTAKPLIIKGKKVQRKSFGTGRVKKQPTPTPEVEAPKTTAKPPKIETPKSTGKPPKVEVPKTTNNKSFMSRHGGKVALGIGVGTAAAYGIHRYKKNKKKKEEARRQAEAEAKRQAELASQKKTGIKRFFK